LQTYQRESKPIGDVYAQVTQLFRDAPDLLEDFKQFLPESAAHAKQVAASAARAADEAIMNSNVRGEPGYGTGQIAQAQTPRPPAKMPPMGQFDPPSTSKENKKRRAPGMGQIAQPALDVGPSGGRGLVQVPNANKVSLLSNPA
jgi:paired amphipathic helix protein Sin3a